MDLQANMDYYFDTASLAKPPRFNKDNFSLWKTRMELFLAGSDPRIPYFLENGPYVPFTLVHVVPATATSAEIPERTIIKEVHQWTDKINALSILTLRQEL